MINREKAEEIAKQYLDEMQNQIGEPPQLVKFQEEFFGWVFFYQAKEYIEMGTLSSMLGGNSPFVVNRKDGSVHPLGTAHSANVYIKEYAQLQSLTVKLGC